MFDCKIVCFLWALGLLKKLQQDKPDDFVTATGETHSVKDLIELAFPRLQLDWKDRVVIGEQLFRPSDIHELRGDYSKAREQLGWEPGMSFEELIRTMVDQDFEQLKNVR